MGLLGQWINDGFLEERVRTAGSVLAMRLAVEHKRYRLLILPGL